MLFCQEIIIVTRPEHSWIISTYISPYFIWDYLFKQVPIKEFESLLLKLFTMAHFLVF